MTAVDILKETMGDLLMDEIPLLRSPKTLQILLLRQTHDFAVFRTEETRELNLVSLPLSRDDSEPTVRVAMLASKQKAPESRLYAALWRQLTADNGVEIPDVSRQCYLKDHLCRRCPRCLLFGAVGLEQDRAAERWNVRHRVEYSTAFSLKPYEEVAELIAFNAVDSATQSTGQALGTTEVVEPVVDFPSVVSLSSVTPEEVVLFLKTLMACRSYGAETRTRGDMTNHILGIVGAYEEVISSLEFTLELAAWPDDLAAQGAAGNGSVSDAWLEATESVVADYRKRTAFPGKVRALTGRQLKAFLREVQAFEFDRPTLERMEALCQRFFDAVEGAAGGGEGLPRPRRRRERQVG